MLVFLIYKIFLSGFILKAITMDVIILKIKMWIIEILNLLLEVKLA
jgi:hypothetical protein